MSKPVSGLWDCVEAWNYLNENIYYMDEMELHDQAVAVDSLMTMTHRTHCRTHMADIAPNYGSECTCDGKYLVDGKLVYPEPEVDRWVGTWR